MSSHILPFPPPSQPPSGNGVLIPAGPELPYVRVVPVVELMRFCYACNRVERFVAHGMFLNGLFGCCAHCLDERVLPWTRTTEAIEDNIFAMAGI